MHITAKSGGECPVKDKGKIDIIVLDMFCLRD